MINFDENQYLYLFDEDYKKEKERRGEPEYMKKVHNTQIMEELAYKLPLRSASGLGCANIAVIRCKQCYC